MTVRSTGHAAPGGPYAWYDDVTGLTFRWSGRGHTVHVYRGPEEVSVLTSGDQRRTNATREEVLAHIRSSVSSVGHLGGGSWRRGRPGASGRDAAAFQRASEKRARRRGRRARTR